MLTSPPPLVTIRPFADGAKLGLPKPTPFGSRTGASRTPSFGVKQEWNGVSSSVWNVKPGDLELVPADFPLERTHREIHNSDVSEVSKRISDALCRLSIEAEYCCKTAKAKCKNSDLVTFRIRLYAGGEDGLPVVVEVQRRSGSARSFMASCRSILDAAEGAKEKKPEKSVPTMKIPVSELKCIPKELNSGVFPDSDGVSAVDHAIGLLRSKQRDTNALGLENLISLTDPVKTSLELALSVAKCVVLGDRSKDIRDELTLFLDRDGFGEEGLGENEEDDGGPIDIEGNLRFLSLKLLSNALLLCSKDGCLHATIGKEAWFTSSLVSLLVDEVNRAPSSACAAYEAAACLVSLLEASPATREAVVDHGGIPALELAREFGLQQHELLAEEAGRCLELARWHA
jgi:hypothetical protein